MGYHLFKEAFHQRLMLGTLGMSSFLNHHVILLYEELLPAFVYNNSWSVFLIGFNLFIMVVHLLGKPVLRTIQGSNEIHHTTLSILPDSFIYTIFIVVIDGPNYNRSTGLPQQEFHLF